eukprot:gene7014-10823_t
MARSFGMPPLPYEYSELAPVISAETLSFHYDKHHTGYFNKLTAHAESKRPDLKGKSYEDMVVDQEKFVQNQAGQIYNHDFYWKSMSGTGGGEPTGALAAKIAEDFGSFGEFKSQFQAAVGAHFGSGWVWLVQDKLNKKLAIMQTHDAGTPIADPNLQPIITCDAWEHAFYIDYRNDKPKYAEAYFKIVNWDFAAKNYIA